MLRAPLPEQQPYQTQPSEISISVDALEAGLRFPLHPTIVECLRWWRISPSQMAPNSWRYLIAFLGECRGAGIVPNRTLFFACFRLYKSRGGYYLTARAGFKVSGAPTNNKGWKARYFFVVVRRCKSINDYKQSVGFGWGLRRMGQVSYEYGYLVALARFQARYPEVRSGGRRWDDVAES
ncbi:hypothetical protein BHE74_00054806 [Ensete ventricosum]|nr:hypothetical protein BHE74_00054806 [Ensete ventricosum]